MKTIHALILGMLILIGLYLGLKNATGVAQIFNAGGPAVTNGVKALQGR